MHVILRGGSRGTNYDAASVESAVEQVRKISKPELDFLPAVMVDASVRCLSSCLFIPSVLLLTSRRVTSTPTRRRTTATSPRSDLLPSARLPSSQR